MWGIFGRVCNPNPPNNAAYPGGNGYKGTTFADIADGTSCTIMIGELQRIGGGSSGTGTQVVVRAASGSNIPNPVASLSHDGWALGGDATGFSTGVVCQVAGSGSAGVGSFAVMNNYHFASPGSEHPNGANFGMADGSVKFLTNSMDATTFALLGSMADGVPGIEVPIN
jgi:prepilin-type processing-associated H-X9-DG protein